MGSPDRAGKARVRCARARPRRRAQPREDLAELLGRALRSITRPVIASSPCPATPAGRIAAIVSIDPDCSWRTGPGRGRPRPSRARPRGARGAVRSPRDRASSAGRGPSRSGARQPLRRELDRDGLTDRRLPATARRAARSPRAQFLRRVGPCAALAWATRRGLGRAVCQGTGRGRCHGPAERDPPSRQAGEACAQQRAGRRDQEGEAKDVGDETRVSSSAPRE